MICHHCKKEIKPGDARYTGGESAEPPAYAHFTCHKEQKNRVIGELRRQGEAGNKLADLFEKLKG
jgi:hypothetical protein